MWANEQAWDNTVPGSTIGANPPFSQIRFPSGGFLTPEAAMSLFDFQKSQRAIRQVGSVLMPMLHHSAVDELSMVGALAKCIQIGDNPIVIRTSWSLVPQDSLGSTESVIVTH